MINFLRRVNFPLRLHKASWIKWFHTIKGKEELGGVTLAVGVKGFSGKSNCLILDFMAV